MSCLASEGREPACGQAQSVCAAAVSDDQRPRDCGVVGRIVCVLLAVVSLVAGLAAAISPEDEVR
jgi:hypothetical protein